MNPAILSIAGLFLAIFTGILAKINIGLLSIGIAFLVGMLVGINPAEIVESWPSNLFMLLFGMSFMFGIAAANGTLKKLVEHSTNALKGHVRFLPLLLFFTSSVVSALGPGNIAVVAIMMPLALTIAKEENISPLLISAMIILGANAGGLSPIAPTGIIANNLAREGGLHVARTLFRDMAGISTFFGILTYVVLKGYKIPRNYNTSNERTPPFTKQQKTTMAIIALAVIAIIFGWNIALTALLASGCLLLLRTATEKEAMMQIPWPAIFLVCGVALMINVVGRTEGMDIIIETLSRFTAPKTAGPIMALLGGLMSLVSSASGVVLPTLIPTVTGISEYLGGAVKPEALISSITVGAHLATLCPVSTLGALAVGAAGSGATKDALFRQLMLAGLIYLLAGGLASYFIVFLY